MAHEEPERRPWGTFVVLEDAEKHKVKRIVVLSGKRFSLQRHARRHEHWHVTSGAGLVTVGDRRFDVRDGDSVDIPAGTKHRMENTGGDDLVFIEIQRGSYFGEDDIERFEDDFGRA